MNYSTISGLYKTLITFIRSHNATSESYFAIMWKTCSDGSRMEYATMGQDSTQDNRGRDFEKAEVTSLATRPIG